MDILKPSAVAILTTPLALVGYVTNPVTGQQSASKTVVYGLDGVTVRGTIGALTHDGKGTRNSALARDAIGTGIGDYIDYQAKKLRESLADTDVKVEQQGNQIRLMMSENVTLTTNNATLSANARDVLTATSKTLAQYPDTTLTANGRIDNTGSNAMNDPLSRNRVQSVASFLQSQGVAGSHLTTIGHGSRQSVASSATPEGRTQGHRVEILISPDRNAVKATRQ